MPVIACLHTADSNMAVFEAAARDMAMPELTLTHHVRADLLAAAERDGAMTPALAAETGRLLAELGRNADAVLLTCSTLGPAVEVVSGAPKPVLRVDAALADLAVKAGGRVVVLVAAPTTLAPTRSLFEAAARATGAEVAVRLVDGAWDLFKVGDPERYLSAIAAAADEAAGAGADEVALAQASMAAAARLTRSARRPLTSPAAGLAGAVAAALPSGGTIL
jgi:hypothetical protein